MALHRRTHPVDVPGCFGCKAIGLSFGIVPGAFRDTNSTSMHDRDALLEQFGHPDGNGSIFDKERVMDAQADVRAKYREFQEAADA